MNKIKWILRFGLDFYEASYAASLLNNVRTSFPEGKAIAIIRVPVPDKELWDNKSHHEYCAIEMAREEYKIFKSVSKQFVDTLQKSILIENRNKDNLYKTFVSEIQTSDTQNKND